MTEGGRKKQPSAWIKHVMAYSKAHGIKFGDALSKAGPSFKSKTAKHGGQLLGKGTPMGGRRGSRRRTAKGGGGNSGTGGSAFGSLYGFGGGPYVGSALSDGAVRNDGYPIPQYSGANPDAMTVGGRRGRGRRYSRRR
jgi:hypothetical protein